MDRRRLASTGIVGLAGISSLLLLARCAQQEAPVAEKPRTVETKVAAITTPAAKPGDWKVFSSTVHPFFVKNCSSCHGDTNPEAGIRLDNFLDAESIEKRAHVLTHALTMLRRHKMPPSDQTQPSAEELKPVMAWLDAYANQVAAEDIKKPGHVTMRRLNRAEYNNTVQDLLGVEFKPADGFPADDAGYGFDNNGDVLTLAPLLMDKYLTAAELVLDKAIQVQPIVPPPVMRWDAAIQEGTVPKGNPTPASAGTQNAGQNNPRGREFPYNGEIYINYEFPKTGTYSLRLKAWGTAGAAPQAAGQGGQPGAGRRGGAPQAAPAQGAAPQGAPQQVAAAPAAAPAANAPVVAPAEPPAAQAATPAPVAPPAAAAATPPAPQAVAAAPGAPAAAAPAGAPQAARGAPAQAQAQAAGNGGGRGAQPARPAPQFKIDGQLVDRPITVAADLRGQVFYSTSAPVKVTAGHHVISLVFSNGATKAELEAALAAAPPAPVPDPADAAAAPANGRGFGRGNRGNVPANGNAPAANGNPAGAAADANTPPAPANANAAPAVADAAAAPANGRGFGRGNRGNAAANANGVPAANPAPAANANNAVADAGAAAAPAAGGAPAGAPAANGAPAAAGAPAAGAPPAAARGNVPPPAVARGRGQAAPAQSPTGKPTLGVVFIEAEGPLENSVERMPESYKKVFVSQPSDTVTKEQAAREIITNFATKAYRRPLKDNEVTRLLNYWTAIDKGGETFERSINLALVPILASPHFLYRVEAEPTAADPQGIHTLNEFELASRLSYFIWSSMPDDELMGLAKEGKLRANLTAQVKRMMASPKSFALCENFAGQWLQLRKMSFVLPDQKFKDFDEPLREAMLKETQLFFSSIMTEDRSVLDFIDADYTFMNERLAKHYGRTDIKGEEFRRVALSGNQRGGIVTQASVLTITSFPTRTSPVIRGKWVLENLLDQAPPPPPPNVPKLEEGATIDVKATLRQRMELHRSNPNCISCHSVMDPIGFGLENFDAIGAWRDRDLNNDVIDASGKLPDGQSFDGPAGLKKILMLQKDIFCECLANRMMTYAVGRGMEQADRPKIAKIAEGMKEKDYKFSSLILQIVESDTFQKQGPKKGDE